MSPRGMKLFCHFEQHFQQSFLYKVGLMLVILLHPKKTQYNVGTKEKCKGIEVIRFVNI